MGSKTIKTTRRFFLRGLGGFTLTLPFLPSLAPARADGRTLMPTVPPRFVAMTTNHGAVLQDNQVPTGVPWLEERTLFEDYVVRRAALPLQASGGQSELAPIYRAPTDELTPSIAAKINLLTGITIPWYIAHNTGGHLGNMARNDGNGGDGQLAQGFPTPTIDQIMAYSPSFGASDYHRRSIVTGPVGRVSWGWEVPPSGGEAVGSGNIVETQRINRTQQLFDALFVPPPSTENPEPERTPLVDLVIEEYRSTRQSNRRLSRLDRERLDAHLARLDDLQRRVTALPRATCEPVTVPGEVTAGRVYHETVNDILAMAFACQTTRIAVIGGQEAPFAGDVPIGWHDVAHNADDPQNQAWLVAAHQGFFRHAFLDLCRKLEIDEGDGTTVLDNSLVMWTTESGPSTHNNTSQNIVTGGAAGGCMNTGMFCDYRDMSPGGELWQYNRVKALRPGLPHNQALATVLQLMGVPASEFNQVPNCGFASASTPQPVTGYGFAQVTGSYQDSTNRNNGGRVNAPGRTERTMDDMNALLPFVSAV